MSTTRRSLAIPGHEPIDLYPLQHGKPIKDVLKVCVTSYRTWVLGKVGDQLRLFADELTSIKKNLTWPAEIDFKKLTSEDIRALGALGLIRASQVNKTKREMEFESDVESEMHCLRRYIGELAKAKLVRKTQFSHAAMLEYAKKEATKDQRRRDKRERERMQRRKIHNAEHTV